jgi:hypothetical protein
VLASVSELLSPGVVLEDGTTHRYTETLHQVVSEEDGCLVHSLQASTSILRHTRENPALLESVPGLKMLVAVTDPHSLWLCFLASTGFDHSVLLDLLLSPEISFASALQDYLSLLATDWGNFGKISSDFDVARPIAVTCSLSESGYGHDPTEYSGHQSAVVVRRLGEDSSTLSTSLSVPLPGLMSSIENLIPTTTASLVDYSSSSSSGDEDTTASKHKGRVMGCLIRLRMSLERLSGRGLAPPHVSSSATDLVSAIGRTEELYDTGL